MISENQENLSVQSLEQKGIEKLELDLIKKKQRVATVENKIAFRPKGNSSKWREELIKSKAEVQNIVNRINRIKRIEDDKLTAVILKDYEEDEKVRKEQARILVLFNKYKEDTITKPDFKPTPRPDFTEVGANWKKERNYQGALEIAQKAFDMAKLRAENSSPVGKSGRTSQLQIARNELNSALKSAEMEDGNVEFYSLRAECRWLETVLAETEAYIKNMRACIDKTEADLALFEKHGLIPEFKN